MKTLNDIKELTYLCGSCNPWKYKGYIKNQIKNSTNENLKKIFNEICIAYSCSTIREDSSWWYFKEDITQEMISPGHIENKYRSPNFVDDFIDAREEIMKQYLEDVKKIYILCKNEMTKRNLGDYPNQLEDLFN